MIERERERERTEVLRSGTGAVVTAPETDPGPEGRIALFDTIIICN